MISKQINTLVKQITKILANDAEIRKLLFFNNVAPPLEDIEPDANEIIDKGYIKTRPVHFQDNTETASFISVNFDNGAIDTEVHVDAIKVAVAASVDNWLTSEGEVRALLIGDRIEALLDHQYIGQSTGKLILTHIQEVYWNAFMTGYVYIFQIVEGRDINALNI